MMASRAAAVAAAALLVGALGCSRAALRIDGVGGEPVGGGGRGGAPTDGGIVDADADAPPPPPPCVVVPAGDPVAMFSFSSGSANASDLMVLDPGDPASASDALVAVKARAADANFWHPEIHMARVSVGPSWPTETVVDQPLTLFVYESHEWGTLARSATADDELAMLWHYSGALVDPLSLRFQRFSTGSWSASPPVDVAVADAYGASLGLAPGPGLGANGVGYGGDGYAASFRYHLEGVGTEAQLAMLSPTGSIVLGPFTVAPATDYPGRGAAVVWSGAEYLIATSYADCPVDDDTFCEPLTIALLRLRPPASAGDPGGLQLAWQLASEGVDREPLRPRAVSHRGTTWLGWTEMDATDPQADRAVRMARADADGGLLGEPWTLAADAHPTTGPLVAVNQHGVFVMWAQDGDTALPPETPGYAQLVIYHLDFDAQALQSPITIDVPSVAYYPGLAVVGLDHPKSVLLSWSALAPGVSDRTEIYLGRLDCEP